MTALRIQRSTEFHTKTTASQSLFDGDGCAMYSSGSAPSLSGDTITGDALEMFSSGSICASTSQTSGDKTEMFSSGSISMTTRALDGDAVHAFSSGS